MRAARRRPIRAEVGKAIVGQDGTVEHLLVALLAQGHVLLEGPPGTAKTFLAQCFAAALGLEFGRIQFTPDLLPGDILGSNLFNFQTSQFTLTRGPIFCELLLADEINRTPPKTQAALLEAMQERRVTLDGETHPLPDALHGGGDAEPDREPGRLSAARGAARPLPVQAAGALSRASRRKRGIVARFGAAQRAAAPGRVRHRARSPTRRQLDAAQRGGRAGDAGRRGDRLHRRGWCAPRARAPTSPAAPVPRAAVLLANAARARAALDGRDYVLPDDVKALAIAVLRHRLLLSPAAEIEGKQVEDAGRRADRADRGAAVTA